ncbi:FtsX-like permease family protein [Ferrimonas pelagia]|uniref:FtsX-like permease family protein n=1 Tax=Ferrimonas pelagia TaxID=1177826 RepID=A0ABP9ECK3_9GAMM
MIKDFIALSLGDMRRHRWLYLWLALGLTLAGALLTGVEALNRAAKSSFTQAEQGLENHYPWRLQSLLSGHRIHQDLYLDLRRAGIAARPVMQKMVRLADGSVVRLRGVELPPGYLRGESGWRTIVDMQVAAQRGWLAGQTLLSDSGAPLPQLALQSDVGPWLLLDISQAAALAKTGPWLSYLELPTLTDSELAWVKRRIDKEIESGLVLREMTQAGDNNLLEAFSLNLTALSTLSFLVGLLLAFHALERLVQHRLHSLKILHQLGFTRRQWLSALAMELGLWSALAALLGSLLGIWLARFLGPGVSDTLVSLYEMEKPLQLAWNWGHALFCFIVLFGALMLMIVYLLRAAGAGRRWHWGAIAVLLALGAWLNWQAQDQNGALALVACTVLLTVLVLPKLLNLGAALLGRLAPYANAPLAWSLWDLRGASHRLVIPIVAITLALSSAISTRILVGSFEQALGEYLDTRLHADIYLYADDATLRQLKPRLEAMPEVARLQQRSQRDGRFGQGAVNLMGYNGTGQPWRFLTFTQIEPDWWQALADGSGCLANEPMAMRHRLSLGQAMTLHSGERMMVCRLVGIYYDYGNPGDEVTVWMRSLAQAFGSAPADGYSLILHEGIDLSATLRQLQQELGLPQASLLAQRTLREQANGLFRRTFVITDALAWLTLVVAMISWFASLAAQQRSWERQQAVVSSLGMVRAQITQARLLQLVCQMGLVALIATGSGVLLGWQLVSKVNPLAFGWSMPVQLGSGQWLSGLVMACGLLILVATGPIWWQSRRSVAAELTREEA